MSIRICIGFGSDLSETSREAKGNSILLFPETYVVVDTETTGLSPTWDDLIEIAAVRYHGGTEVARFQSLIQSPKGPEIDPFIIDLTGITPDMLRDAPRTADVVSRFADFLGNDIIVGYNVGFDVNFLYDNYMHYLHIPLTNDFINVTRIARKLYPEMEHHRLVDMVEKFGIRHDHAHRALSDVLAVFLKLNGDHLIDVIRGNPAVSGNTQYPAITDSRA